jgi:regulator of sigma D
MLENCKTREERWGGVEALIEAWLKERQELIVLYCSLSGAQAKLTSKSRTAQKLQKFCEILVDYVSAGHFEIYDQLLKEAEDFQDGSEQLAICRGSARCWFPASKWRTS